MNPAPSPEPPTEPGTGDTVAATGTGPREGVPRAVVILIGAVAACGLAASVFLWQKVTGMQEQLARQSADAGTAAVEARAMARQSLDQSRDTAARARFIDALDLFGIGYSWGGFESLVIPFDPASIRTARRWPAGRLGVRLSIGLEDPADLIADLEQALARMGAA